MRDIKSYDDDELIEIGLLAIQYVQAYQGQQQYRINNPVSTLAELMTHVKPTNQAHSDLEMAVLSGDRHA